MSIALLNRQTAQVIPIGALSDAAALPGRLSHADLAVRFQRSRLNAEMLTTASARRSAENPNSASVADLQSILVDRLNTLAEPTAAIQWVAPDLAPAELQNALRHLAGVIVNTPAGWSEAYQFNLREIILAAGLVEAADQIYVVEDAIAALLAELPNPQLTPHGASGVCQPGPTLVLSAGATMTELLLVDVPVDLSQLTSADFHLRSFAYAGDAIDQDILAQLLVDQALPEAKALPPRPRPGEPDCQVRERWQQHLSASEAGRSLLITAGQLKLALQQEPMAILAPNQEQRHQLDCRQQILMPYFQRLNHELNRLLAEAGMSTPAVRQVILSGGSVLLTLPWLHQKLPHAMQIHSSAALSSRVAVGLARLPLYPQAFDSSRHRYSQLFLLHELLQALPDRPLTIAAIFQALEQRGINTHACQRTLLRLLEGPLPTGLVASSQFNSSALFLRPDRQTYHLNPDLRDRLQADLAALLEVSIQTCDEPLLAQISLPIA